MQHQDKPERGHPRALCPRRPNETPLKSERRAGYTLSFLLDWPFDRQIWQTSSFSSCSPAAQCKTRGPWWFYIQRRTNGEKQDRKGRKNLIDEKRKWTVFCNCVFSTHSRGISGDERKREVQRSNRDREAPHSLRLAQDSLVWPCRISAQATWVRPWDTVELVSTTSVTQKPTTCVPALVQSQGLPLLF